jgi:Raf kinase inhibitor-like YbhB/YbcL family protein
MLVLAAMIAVIAAQQPVRGGQAAGPAGPDANRVQPLVLTSPAFPDGSQIPLKFTSAGEGVSPQLNWTNTPPNTVTFLLHMHDMDGTRNHTSEDGLHWLMWNIPGSSTGLPEGVPQGQLKDGSYQITAPSPVDPRGHGYRAPGAPANGPIHHYMIELFALDTKLDVTPGTDPYETRKSVLDAMQGHIVGKALYMGFFHLPPGVTPERGKFK